MNLLTGGSVLSSTGFIGGSLFGLLSKNNRFGRNPVVLLGILVHFVAFYLIFLNMPGDAPIAPLEGTDSRAYISSRYRGRPFPSSLGGGWVGRSRSLKGAASPPRGVCYLYIRSPVRCNGAGKS